MSNNTNSSSIYMRNVTNNSETEELHENSNLNGKYLKRKDPYAFHLEKINKKYGQVLRIITYTLAGILVIFSIFHFFRNRGKKLDNNDNHTIKITNHDHLHQLIHHHKKNSNFSYIHPELEDGSDDDIDENDDEDIDDLYGDNDQIIDTPIEFPNDLNVTEQHHVYPRFSLPLWSGQSNTTHLVGAFRLKMTFPKVLTVKGTEGNHRGINGDYKVMFLDKTHKSPMLFHGRLIWKQIVHHGEKPHYIYYDHKHNHWVINDDLKFENLKPIAFITYDSLFPFKKNRDTHFNMYGVPHHKSWIVRDMHGKSEPHEDPKISVDAIKVKENCVNDKNCGFAHLLNVFHILDDPDRKKLHDEMDEFDGDEDDSHLHDTSDEELMWSKIQENFDDNSLLDNDEAKLVQMYVSHIPNDVYHTFPYFHSRIDHDKILDDPLKFLNSYIHKQGVEIQSNN